MELAAPITIYWDLAIQQERVAETCRDIIDCRPLMLQLFTPVFGPGCACLDVLEHFRQTLVAVSLTVPAAALTPENAGLLSGLRLRELLLYGERPDEFGASVELAAAPDGAVTGISFQVNAGNWLELPNLLAECRRLGVRRLVLPMQRLYGGEQAFMLTRPEQRRLSTLLEGAGGGDGLDLTIHDPFLWRAFYPERPFPQAGCQAANTMLAIGPDLGVYPCPTLPVPLGTLGSLGLKEIATSPEKREFRRKLTMLPAGCDGCGESDVCRGGCRGRGYCLHGSLDGIDDACL